MSDLLLLKQRIHEDNRIPDLLQSLGCLNISEEQRGNLIVAQLPDRFNSDNPRSIQVHNTETLPSYVRSRGISGDILALVGYILYPDECKDFEGVKTHLRQIKTYICNSLDYPQFLKRTSQIAPPKKDYNGWLHDIKRQRSHDPDPTTVEENEVLPESTLAQYIPYGHSLFLRDGVSYHTQRQFEVVFDILSERIVFPIRNRDGQLIGVKGRYAGDDTDTMEHRKYLYLYPCDKSVELFNLHRALAHILARGEVIVVEGAKTCMLLTQWGYPNCVAIEGNALTPVQAMLLKELGVQIVFAYDRDIYYPKGVYDLEFIQRQIKQIKNRILHVIIDSTGLLQDHDSPTDRGKAVWDTLYRDYREVMTGVN